MSNWKTIKEVSSLPGMPRGRTLYAWTKLEPLPPFMKKLSKLFYIDMEHPDFLAKKKRFEEMPKNANKARPEKIKDVKARKQPKEKDVSHNLDYTDPSVHLAAYDRKIAEADLDHLPLYIKDRLNLEKLYQEVAAKKLQNQTLERKLHKEDYQLIEWALAEYLFFGFLEKFTNELLKLKDKLETPIRNLVNEQDAEGILKRMHREHQSLIKEVKKAQALDLQNWKAENSVDV